MKNLQLRIFFAEVKFFGVFFYYGFYRFFLQKLMLLMFMTGRIPADSFFLKINLFQIKLFEISFLQ